MKTPEVVHDLEIKFGNEYGPDEEQAAVDVIRASAPSCAKKVNEFEETFAAYCGMKCASTCTSATTCLTLAGGTAGVGSDTEVITTPISWLAIATGFSVLGATVEFCDVDRNTLNMDHLAGNCCEMDRSMEIAKRHGLAVIEDCANA